jgi:hypothetical protein
LFATATSIEISPASVNLTAFPTRLDNNLAEPDYGSPSTTFGNIGIKNRRSVATPLFRARAAMGFDHFGNGFADVERSLRSDRAFPASIFEKIKNVIDHRKERFSRGVNHRQIVALTLLQTKFPAQVPSCRSLHSTGFGIS